MVTNPTIQALPLVDQDALIGCISTEAVFLISPPVWDLEHGGSGSVTLFCQLFLNGLLAASLPVCQPGFRLATVICTLALHRLIRTVVYHGKTMHKVPAQVSNDCPTLVP